MTGAMEAANPPTSHAVVTELPDNAPPSEQDTVQEKKTKGKG